MLFTIIESIKKKLVMIGDLLLTLSAFWMNLVKLIKKLYHKDSEQKWILSSWKARNEQKQFIVGFILGSEKLTRWHEFFRSITECREIRPLHCYSTGTFKIYFKPCFQCQHLNLHVLVHCRQRETLKSRVPGPQIKL